MAEIRINRTTAVDDGEVTLAFARSGGAGGQHVNTSSTKVELRWNVDDSACVDERQKALIHQRLGNRINAEGELILQSSEHRSQTRNREAVIARFANLLAEALRVQASRRPTKPTQAARRRRLDSKRRRAQTKILRRNPPPE